MDIFISPSVSDYQLLQGSPVRDPMAGLANAVYLRLVVPLGSYWADPSLGSRLHELEREKDMARYSVLAKQYAQTALQPLIDDGRATDIEIGVGRIKDGTGAGRVLLAIQVTAASGEVQTFQHALKVI